MDGLGVVVNSIPQLTGLTLSSVAGGIGLPAIVNGDTGLANNTSPSLVSLQVGVFNTIGLPPVQTCSNSNTGDVLTIATIKIETNLITNLLNVINPTVTGVSAFLQGLTAGSLTGLQYQPILTALKDLLTCSNLGVEIGSGLDTCVAPLYTTGIIPSL